MQLLQGMLILFLLLGLTLPAQASDPEVQADLLLARISAALKDDRMSAALSACAQLEKLGPSLAKPLPEIFYYNYIATLQRSGVKESLLGRAAAYLQKYGKKAPHYRQVTAIISELEQEAMNAGKGAADGAALAREDTYRLQKEKEHEQTLQGLRACQGEAIALEVGEKELDAAYEEINAQSNALLVEKTALDQRVTLLNRLGQGTPEEQKQLRADFNRDSQAYNAAVSAFGRAQDLYAAKVEEYNNQRQGYDDRCADLFVLKYDLETVCGESADWFCRSLE
jgi:hypothetical protein